MSNQHFDRIFTCKNWALKQPNWCESGQDQQKHVEGAATIQNLGQIHLWGDCLKIGYGPSPYHEFHCLKMDVGFITSHHWWSMLMNVLRMLLTSILKCWWLYPFIAVLFSCEVSTFHLHKAPAVWEISSIYPTTVWDLSWSTQILGVFLSFWWILVYFVQWFLTPGFGLFMIPPCGTSHGLSPVVTIAP